MKFLIFSKLTFLSAIKWESFSIKLFAAWRLSELKSLRVKLNCSYWEYMTIQYSSTAYLLKTLKVFQNALPIVVLLHRPHEVAVFFDDIAIFPAFYSVDRSTARLFLGSTTQMSSLNISVKLWVLINHGPSMTMTAPGLCITIATTGDERSSLFLLLPVSGVLPSLAWKLCQNESEDSYKILRWLMWKNGSLHAPTSV